MLREKKPKSDKRQNSVESSQSFMDSRELPMGTQTLLNKRPNKIDLGVFYNIPGRLLFIEEIRSLKLGLFPAST